MLTREEIKQKIVTWINENNWSHTEFSTPTVYFHCIINLKDGRKYNIVIEKIIDRIDFISTIDVPEDYQSSYKLSKDKYKFWTDLKVNLMLMDISTMVYPNLEELKTLEISAVLYFDAFSQDRFMQLTNKFADAIGLCNIMWKKFIDSQVKT